MPRGSRRNQAPALDNTLVSNFHTLILDGNISEVNMQLTSTRRLGNAKDVGGFTPLMKVVSSKSLHAQTQIKLIDSLMQKGGASLATRGPGRHHVLLLACKSGAAPEVIDCLCSWNSKRGGQNLHWSHCNEDKDGAVVLAARSGSLTLVSHLFSSQTGVVSSYCDSNAPIKVLDAAIRSGNEELVLFLLCNESFKEEVADIDIYDSDDDSYDSYEQPASTRSIRVKDCVELAYKRQMIQAVCEMSSLGRDAPVWVWLYWRQKPIDPKSLSTKSRADAKKLEAIAKKAQGDIVHERNPLLLPLLLARSRYMKKSAVDDVTDNSTTENDIAQVALKLPDAMFRLVAEYCFILCPEKLQKEVESNIYFQENAEYCFECEGWFLPYSCYCHAYGGYSS